MTGVIRRRKNSLRLTGYDYAQAGAYFITTTLQGRVAILADICNDKFVLTLLGKIVRQAWLDLPRHYPMLVLDAFCVMPDHFHGIMIIQPGRGRSPLMENDIQSRNMCDEKDDQNGIKTCPSRSISEMVRAFKSFSARRINAQRKTPGTTVWQRGFYEHIIRDEADLNRIRVYIRDNPVKWNMKQTDSDWGERK